MESPFLYNASILLIMPMVVVTFRSILLQYWLKIYYRTFLSRVLSSLLAKLFLRQWQNKPPVIERALLLLLFSVASVRRSKDDIDDDDAILFTENAPYCNISFADKNAVLPPIPQTRRILWGGDEYHPR